MATFLIKRIAQAVFVVFVVTLLVAYAIRLSGDPAIMLTQGAGSFTAQDLENIRRALGLDRPFSAQYLGFLGGLLRGDFGRSFFGQTPVAALLGDAVQSTLLLTAMSLVLSIALAIPLGIHAAVHRGRAADQVIRILSLVGLSFPNFWLAIMLVLVFAVQLNWLPASGSEHATNLIMPAGTMAIILAATTVRLVRTSMLETLSAQYIMVARSKGLRERVVLYKHALRNCAIPIITYIGVQFGNLIGNVVVIERVFAWPGLGSLAFDAVQARDYPVLQGSVTVLALLIVSVNLLIDIVYGLVDPPDPHGMTMRMLLRHLHSLELVLGALLSLTMILLVVCSGWLFPDGGESMDLADRLLPPFASWSHILGTDPLGRDMLARVIVGGQISLTVGFVSVLGAVVFGTVIGLVAGYYRGLWDIILMRCADVQLALPFILLAVTFTAILGADLWNLIFFMVISQWVQYARVMRGSVLSLRGREFVLSAKASGVSDGRILLDHILPNGFAPVLIIMMLNVANNILLESSLTFLGVGVDPSIPSWGGMLADGRTYMQTAWWVCVFPGLAIMLTVLGLNLLGDWLRDLLDPTIKV